MKRQYVIVTTAFDGMVVVWGDADGAPFRSIRKARSSLRQYAWAQDAVVHLVASAESG